MRRRRKFFVHKIWLYQYRMITKSIAKLSLITYLIIWERSYDYEILSNRNGCCIKEWNLAFYELRKTADNKKILLYYTIMLDAFIYKVSLIKIILPFFSIMILIRFYIKGWLRQPKQIWKNCYIFPK